MAKFKVKPALTPAQREQLNDKIRQETAFRDQVKGDDLAPGELGGMQSDRHEVDTGILDKRIELLKRQLADGTPERLSGKAREAAEREYRELGDKLSGRLLTRREMDLMPRHGHDYSVAVKKSMKQEVGSPETQQMVSRYRALGAALDPDNPEACSTEALRREK